MPILDLFISSTASIRNSMKPSTSMNSVIGINLPFSPNTYVAEPQCGCTVKFQLGHLLPRFHEIRHREDKWHGIKTLSGYFALCLLFQCLYEIRNCYLFLRLSRNSFLINDKELIKHCTKTKKVPDRVQMPNWQLNSQSYLRPLLFQQS